MTITTSLIQIIVTAWNIWNRLKIIGSITFSYVFFPPEISHFFNVSEFRTQFFQTKASPLLMASRDKISKPIILSVTCFRMAQFHWCPHESDRNAMAMRDKHISVTVPVCHSTQFTLFFTRCLTASIIPKCSNAARVFRSAWEIFATYRS